MTDSELKTTLQSDMKTSMKSGAKARLAVIRLILAAIKQIEVDERIDLDNNRILAVLDKMTKQRRESIAQFEKADRTDLIAIEQSELVIISEYLPEALSEQEINQMVDDSIRSTGAQTIRDMGKVMGQLKPKLQGRADMSQVSLLIKSRLNG
ncbi:MAG: hypothetical protein ACI8XC_000310 [Gammaproteobacteria bacterium]|jgi:uncharacterized protein YqeY